MDKGFFARRADLVAKDLLGRYFTCQEPNKGHIIKARLRAIGAYEGFAKTSPGEMYAHQGLVFISTKYGHNLLHVSTGKAKEASCLTLIDADIEKGKMTERVHGPGNLAYKLGINSSTRDFYQFATVGEDKVWIEGESIPQDIIKRKEGNAENCLGIYYF